MENKKVSRHMKEKAETIVNRNLLEFFKQNLHLMVDPS